DRDGLPPELRRLCRRDGADHNVRELHDADSHHSRLQLPDSANPPDHGYRSYSGTDEQRPGDRGGRANGDDYRQWATHSRPRRATEPDLHGHPLCGADYGDTYADLYTSAGLDDGRHDPVRQWDHDHHIHNPRQ